MKRPKPSRADDLQAIHEVCWLHLTDLHIGQPREGSRLPSIESAFHKDITDLITATQRPIEVIFFTGDIAFRGSREEYARATAMRWCMNLSHCRSFPRTPRFTS